VHISNEVHAENESGRQAAQFLLEGKSLEYLQVHAPIGTRDLWTLELLRAKNVEAYFSGCMTLTFGTGQAQPRHDYVCAVDLSEPALTRLRELVRSRVVVTTHADPTPASFADRSRRAKRLLSIYAHVKCVVTSRLHCALPCLALQTPVLLVISAQDTYRFSGLNDLVRNCKLKEFVDDVIDFDPNDPQANSDGYCLYRQKLIHTVSRFIEPAIANADAPLHPFVPDPDTDNLIAIEQSFVQLGEAAKQATRIFQGIFKPGLDYSRFSRPDFLRELANAHRALGNLNEARRLLEAANSERPEGAHIKKLLDAVLLKLSRR
jgi:hypothetical protein